MSSPLTFSWHTRQRNAAATGSSTANKENSYRAPSPFGTEMPRGKQGPRLAVATIGQNSWPSSSSTFVSPSKVRLSADRAQTLTQPQLAQYHWALARFLTQDRTYGCLHSQGALYLWQEVLLAFPGAYGLPPLPIDWETCKGVVEHGTDLSLTAQPRPQEWPLLEPPTHLGLVT